MAKVQKKAGRPAIGSTDYRTKNAKLTVDAQLKTERWAASLSEKCQEVLEELLFDETAAPQVRKGVADKIMNINREWYEKRKSGEETTVAEEEAEELERAAEANGGKPLLSLTYSGD